MNFVWVGCLLGGTSVDGVAATTCSTSSATVSNYAGYAAAMIEYEDCTTKVVKVVTASDGATQLDLRSKKIVYVKSLPSVERLTSSSGKLEKLQNLSFPDGVVTLNLSDNPISYVGGVVFPSSLQVLVITSTVKLAEFEVRQTDATLFTTLQTFNVSATTTLTCSDSDAMFRLVQDTLLCVLADDVFNSKYGVAGASSASGSVDVASTTAAPVLQEAHNARRSKYLLFAAIVLSLACVGLLSTLAPRTLYERYQKKKLLRKKKQKQEQHQQQLLPIVQPTILQVPERDPNIAFWDL
ncbi:unnamed protein product [Phytophthora lilii]|uniref:Unnamed protein product n=1 Tax=Phytophthora lilii TaxID=2077276 RepID=A0A9W6TF74_9STRA|nr:unnamed protein product [Phytophthora lilii]